MNLNNCIFHKINFNFTTTITIAILSLMLLSCSKNTEDPIQVNPELVVPDLVLTKTELVVANPLRNLSSYYYWITKSPTKDAFYIHNADNDSDTSVRGMMLYDVATNTFTNKAKCPNIVAAGYTSQLMTLSAGNGYLAYIANEFNEYDCDKDTWIVKPANYYFPANIKANHGSSQGCLRFSKGAIFYIGGITPCKTVKKIDSGMTWDNFADYPVEITGGPEVVANSIICMYALGGYDSSGTKIKEFFKYTDATNAWTKLPDAPINAATDNLKRKMVFFKDKYVIYLGTDYKLHIFNTQTNKWQTTTVDVTGTIGQEHLEVSTNGNAIFLLYRKANNSLGIQEFE